MAADEHSNPERRSPRAPEREAGRRQSTTHRRKAQMADESVSTSSPRRRLLLSTHHPLTAGRLAELMDLESTTPVRKAIKQLNTDYETTGRAFRIEQVAGGFQILTLAPIRRSP